jgi:hypothetical protein
VQLLGDEKDTSQGFQDAIHYLPPSEGDGPSIVDNLPFS